MVFYCEQAAGFTSDIGYDDESFLTSLATMFEQAVMLAITLPAQNREALLARLAEVRDMSRVGYGVQDHMDFVLPQIE